MGALDYPRVKGPAEMQSQTPFIDVLIVRDGAAWRLYNACLLPVEGLSERDARACQRALGTPSRACRGSISCLKARGRREAPPPSRSLAQRRGRQASVRRVRGAENRRHSRRPVSNSTGAYQPAPRRSWAKSRSRSISIRGTVPRCSSTSSGLAFRTSTSPSFIVRPRPP